MTEKKDPHWEGTIIIGLAGRKKVGKDTAADYFVDTYKGAIKINFSDPILEEVNTMLAVHDLQVDPDNKEPYRRLLQEWGELRREQDEDYWNKKIEKRIDRYIRNKKKLILVCGPRAIPEFEMVRVRSGELWKIIRPLKTADVHKTEQSVDAYGSFDRYILNDSSIPRLEIKIEKTLDDLLEERD